MRTRSGEAARPWFRSERYYHTGEGWWFMTRENEEAGPFISQHDAENELILYIRHVNMHGDIPTMSQRKH
ncbi:MAG: hypothetical protein COA86_01935 [Kangiella sp.]|nr:MAG: hypothetical protein COA86_01935 [Kangiella sp.]